METAPTVLSIVGNILTLLPVSNVLNRLMTPAVLFVLAHGVRS